jgi:hypothetical protein
LPFLPLILLIIAASAVVAISANGLRLLLPPIDLEGPRLWGVRIVGATAVVAGLAVLIVHRTRPRRDSARDGDSTAGALRTAATIMGLLTVVAFLVAPPPDTGEGIRPWTRSAGGETGSGNEPGGGGTQPSGMTGEGGGGRGSGGGGVTFGQPTPPGPPTQPGQSLFQRLAGNPALMVALFLVVVCLLILRHHLRRRTEVFQTDFLLAPEDAEAGLEASLEQVAWEGGNPREQVTGAYHRLLAALTAAGAPRQIQEAPHEHLYRVLGPLGAHPEPLHRLTGLYVMAQFSERTVTEGHRAAAARALEDSLASLRRVSGSPGADELDPIPAAAPA